MKIEDFLVAQRTQRKHKEHNEIITQRKHKVLNEITFLIKLKFSKYFKEHKVIAEAILIKHTKKKILWKRCELTDEGGQS